LIAFTTSDWRIFAGFFWIQALGIGFCLGPLFASIQLLVPENCRATATVIVLMLMNLIGGGLGPLAIGVGSDLLKPHLGVDSLRWMMVACALWAIVPALLYFRASRGFKADSRDS